MLREHADEAVGRYRVGWRERKVLRLVTSCRTPWLGGHLEVCPGCGHQHPAYNSCRNRHCPQCQDGRRAAWLARRIPRTLPVPHFQVVFTLPSELRPLARRHPALMYELLFDAGSHVLQRLARERMGGQLGMLAVLHTWTRELSFHPHVHFVVTAGGLSVDGADWVASRPKFLFPVAIMRKMFRGRLLDRLRHLHRDGEVDDTVPKAALYRKDWVVHVTAPDDRPAQQMLRYLGRYVYGVAISDRRLVAYDGHAVTFRTRNGETATLAGPEFTRRFLLHVLPKAFHKVRYYGLYAPASGPRLTAAFALHATELPETPEPVIDVDEDDDLTDEGPAQHLGPVMPVCPACRAHRLIRQPLPSTRARGPPWWW